MISRTLYYCFFILLLLIPLASFAQREDNDKNSNVSEDIEKRAHEKYISDKQKRDFRFENDTVIKSDSLMPGNVIVIDGDLTVRGEIRGDVLVIMGNVYIKSDAVINGNVTSINGSIFQNRASLVTGNQIETRARNLFTPKELHDEDKLEQLSHLGNVQSRYNKSYSTLNLGRYDEEVVFRYNRVQGLFLGITFPKEIAGKYNYFTLHGFGGYGFEESAWRYQLGIDRWFFNQKKYRFEIGAKAYDLTDTKDNWLINPLENSLAALLIHEDFQDFYRRYGYELHASQNITIFFKGTLGYRNERFRSLEKNTDWAIFGGDKKFDENPPVTEGRNRSLFGELYLDSRDNRETPRDGWYAKLAVETSNSELNSDYSFNRYQFEIRRYQQIGRYERLDMRFKIGSAEGGLPLQKSYEIGGISTLRGYDYKAFSYMTHEDGSITPLDRMLLANFEYNISPRILNTSLLFFDDVRYMMFFDAGAAWNRAQVSEEDAWNAGFNNLTWNDIKTDFGVALTSWSGKARLSIAKRLDTGIDPVRVTFRLSKPF